MNSKPNHFTDCRACVARGISLFCGGVTDDELNEFMEIKKIHNYDKHDIIFHEDTPSHGIYILCSGRIKLTNSSRFGQQQILKIVSAGEIIEKNGLFNTGKHTVTAETLERSEVTFFEREDFLTLLKNHSDLSIRLINVLSQELEKSQQRINQLTFKDAKGRLALILLDLAKSYGVKNKDGIALGITLKREEIAEMTGMTLETAVRLLSQFKKDRVIKVEGKQIILINQQRLQTLSN
ncbi:MAG TPA: Crp/Fnr family transcriptional regulator [Nitrospiria bacterium]|jgi:CRP/FNR family transcriptional regulator